LLRKRAQSKKDGKISYFEYLSTAFQTYLSIFCVSLQEAINAVTFREHYCHPKIFPPGGVSIGFTYQVFDQAE